LGGIREWDLFGKRYAQSRHWGYTTKYTQSEAIYNFEGMTELGIGLGKAPILAGVKRGLGGGA